MSRRWIDRLLDARDRLLADPKFQAWAARFPLTRFVARRRANALFDLTAGFVYSQVLEACVRLRVLELLQGAPATVDELAPKLMLSIDATKRLLNAAVSLGLLARRGRKDGAPRYGLAMNGAALLGNPGALAMIDHHALLYADLADPVALLRGDKSTRLSQFWPYAARDDAMAAVQAVTPYTALMGASQSLVAADILDAYDFGQHRHLVDAGGGDGTFLRAVAARVPNLATTLFDLPAVIVRAKAAEPPTLADRFACVAGDLWRDPLPSGADVVSLVRVLHDHDDAPALDLLRRIARSLPAGGTIVIAEPMVTGSEDERVGNAYFSFYLLAMGSGRARTPADISSLLSDAGFSRTEHVATRRPLLCSMMVARRR